LEERPQPPYRNGGDEEKYDTRARDEEVEHALSERRVKFKLLQIFGIGRRMFWRSIGHMLWKYYGKKYSSALRVIQRCVGVLKKFAFPEKILFCLSYTSYESRKKEFSPEKRSHVYFCGTL
jgi:hypothetical protein